MKKSITFLTILLSVLLTFGCSKKRAEMAGREAVISGIIGDVVIKKDNKEYPVKVGDLILTGMTIETGDRSLIEIRIGDDTIRLFENTVLFIDKLDTNVAANIEQAEFNLIKGEVFSRIMRQMKSGDVYQVRTPTTVAAVRGTEFTVSATDERSKVSCVQGKVYVVNLIDDSSLVEISANEEAIDVKEQPIEVIVISEKDLRRIRIIFENMSQPNFVVKDAVEYVEQGVKRQVIDPSKPSSAKDEF